MSLWPANLSEWEPQLDAISWIQVEGDLVSVRLERDPQTSLPSLWRATASNETFPCSRHRWWCPRAGDWS